MLSLEFFLAFFEDFDGALVSFLPLEEDEEAPAATRLADAKKVKSVRAENFMFVSVW